MSGPLYLVDASGLLHRAFHAIRPLRTSRGVPTNALFGLAQMVRRLIREHHPERIAVVFDAGRETFRNRLYPAYKANRPPTHPDLVPQFPLARRLCEALGLPVLEVPDFEADDVIATLCERAVAEGLEVVIESGDKDLLQLVRPGVTVRDPLREEALDAEGVKARLGVPPGAVRDYLALLGDSSDNVPGVPGIGKKGAADLLDRYGSLEGLFLHLEELPPRARESLRQHRDAVFLSRDLVTLRTDVPLPSPEAPLEALRLGPPDPAVAVPLLTELEFRSLIRDLGLAPAPGGAPGSSDHAAAVLPGVAPGSGPAEVTTPGTRPPVVGSDLEAREALDRLRAAGSGSLVALFGPRDPVRPALRGLAVVLEDGTTLAFPPETDSPELAATLAEALARGPWNTAGFKEIGQWMEFWGLAAPLPAFDACLASYLLDSEREDHSLDALALQVLKRPVPPAQDGSPEALGARAEALAAMVPSLRPRLVEQGLWSLLADIEIPLSRLLGEMERTGVGVNPEVLGRLSGDLSTEVQRLEKAILDAAGFPFNPNSPKQLADVLFGRLGLPVQKRTRSGPSTDQAVLEELAPLHPVPALILEFRSLTRLKNTYADVLPRLVHPATGRIHTSYNQTVASTGRLSSSDPNLQNIPVRTATGRRIRSAFVAAPGREFISADYSQIELRILAHLSGDQALAEAFQGSADIHRRTAARFFHCPEDQVTPDQRRAAKAINFGVLYGMGAYRLGRDLRIPIGEAQHFIDDYFAAFPAVRAFLDRTLEEARIRGYVVTALGRRRRIEGLSDRNHNLRAQAERMAINMPVQGTAADILKIAMVRVRDRLRIEVPEARLVLTVHDELIVEAPEGTGETVATLLREEMTRAFPLRVPLAVEIGRGRSWSDLHE
ncbi:MAG TPA: DNA polymerase I [Myxococcota bacterium]|nr:DNA polymerase I [Myxococcota bacterium]HQK51417.1 DNA polymerase I [Myxococcota bacterium]